MRRRIPSKLSFNSSCLPRLDTGLKIRTKSAHKKCPQHLRTKARSSRRGDDTMGVGARPRRRRRCSNLVRSESRWYVTHAILWQKRAICLSSYRRMYWSKRCHHLHRQRMVLRHQNGLLFRWLVAEPTILLLGDGGG